MTEPCSSAKCGYTSHTTKTDWYYCCQACEKTTSLKHGYFCQKLPFSLPPHLIIPISKKYKNISRIPLNTWSGDSIKQSIEVDHKFANTMFVKKFPNNTTYIKSTGLNELKAYYQLTNIFGIKRDYSESEVYVSTGAVYIFLVKGSQDPVEIWNEVTVEGGDGTTFFISVLNNDPTKSTVFDVVQVSPV